MPRSADKVSKKESFLFKLTLYFSCTLPGDSLPRLPPRFGWQEVPQTPASTDGVSPASCGRSHIAAMPVATTRKMHSWEILRGTDLRGTEKKAEHQWGHRKAGRKQ